MTLDRSLEGEDVIVVKNGPRSCGRCASVAVRRVLLCIRMFIENLL